MNRSDLCPACGDVFPCECKVTISGDTAQALKEALYSIREGLVRTRCRNCDVEILALSQSQRERLNKLFPTQIEDDETCVRCVGSN